MDSSSRTPLASSPSPPAPPNNQIESTSSGVKGSNLNKEEPVVSDSKQEMVEKSSLSTENETIGRRQSTNVITKGFVQNRRRLFESSGSGPTSTHVFGRNVIKKSFKRAASSPTPDSSKPESTGMSEIKKMRVSQVEDSKMYQGLTTDTKPSAPESQEVKVEGGVAKHEAQVSGIESVAPKIESVAASSTTPVSTVCHSAKVNARIKILEAEMAAEKQKIVQISKFLNLCVATGEFYESKENMEGERVLLVATQKRMALLGEIQKLTSIHQFPISSSSSSTNTVNITICNVVLPLKRHFMARKFTGHETHYFLCLVKYQQQVESSKLVSISTDQKVAEVKFNYPIKISNVHTDSQVQIEIYGLQAVKESLPHQAKYHIKKELTSRAKTTIVKLKTAPNLSPSLCSLTRSFHCSPNEPVPLATPKFNLLASIRIDINDEGKKKRIS